jgi:dolichol-phosphate mannosyltransferase
MGERPLALLSVVVPMYDEEGSARAFYDRLVAALDGVSWELIAVDDGSRDATRALLERWPATTTACASCTCRATSATRPPSARGWTTPPATPSSCSTPTCRTRPSSSPPWSPAGARARTWSTRRGHNARGETPFKLSTARAFYRILGKRADLPMQADAGDFRLLDRRALDALLAMPERNRYLRGMTVWVGFTQTAVVRGARKGERCSAPTR